MGDSESRKLQARCTPGSSENTKKREREKEEEEKKEERKEKGKKKGNTEMPCLRATSSFFLPPPMS